MNVIYLITNQLNRKVYVGQTTRSLEARWYEHTTYYKQYSYYISNAMKKYGIENFRVEEICRCKNLKELNIAEDFLIRLLGSHKSCFGYNQRMGGSPGGYSKETKEMFSKLVRARIANYTYEQRSAMTVAMRRRYKELQDQGIQVGRTEPHKIESIELMRAVKLGKKQTPESNSKRSVSQTGKKSSDETRKNVSNGGKKVWAELTGEARNSRIEKQRASLLATNSAKRAAKLQQKHPLSSQLLP